MPSADFTPDSELQAVATRSAELCVKFIKHRFGKTADYSEAFLPEVESILGLLHVSMPASKPSEDDIEQFCSMFGSYLGETYRRNRGGEWGVSDGNTPTLSFGGDFKSFPWVRVYKRLINGDEDNVHDWYLGMIQYAAGGGTSPAAPPPLPKAPLSPPSNPPALPSAAVRGLAQDLLASLLSLKGRTIEAVAQRRAALEKLEEILGRDHPELQSSLDELARDLLRVEDFAEATPVLQRIYEYRVAQLGPEHPDTLERLALLTECLLSAELPAEAMPLLQQQLVVSERLKGGNHEDTLTVLQLLAKAYDQQGDRPSSESLLRRAQVGCERTLGLTHPKSLASLYALFENLSEGADPAAAEPFGEKLVSASQKAYGPHHPLSVSAVYLLANLYGRRQNFAAGIAVVRQTLAAFPSDKNSLSVEQAKLQSLLAALLDLAGQIDEAAPLARSAAYALYGHLGPNHADTERVYRHVIDLSKRRSLRTPLGRFRMRCLRILAKLLPFRRRDHGNNAA